MAKVYNLTHFIEWLRAEIGKSGLSVNGWAKLKHIQQSTLSRVLSGKRGASPDLLAACGWETCYRRKAE